MNFTLVFVMLFAEPAEQVCFASDVTKLCCPTACKVKNDSAHWFDADKVLRGCMRGIGCSDSESKSATVGMRCDCAKGKP